MKTKNIIVQVFFFVLLFSSCENNFDPQIYGALFSTNYPQTEADYESYILSSYPDLLGGWARRFMSGEGGIIKFFDTPSDYTNLQLGKPSTASTLEWPQGNFSNAHLYPKSPAGSTPTHYEKTRWITRQTEIIDVVQKATILTEEKKKNFLGEARMLRGIYMYYLMHMYGPVPVIIDPALVGDIEAERNIVRPTLEQMTKYIYDDFDFAQQNMSNIAPNGRYTADYAKFCLMRHCLNEGSYMSGYYDKAIEMYQSLKASNKNYALFTKGGAAAYAEQFMQANKFNVEIIMALSTSPNGDGSNYLDMFCFTWYTVPADAARYADVANTIPTPFEKQGGGWSQRYSIPPSYYDAYEPGDLRREVILTSYVQNNAERTVVTREDVDVKWNGFIINKYPIETNDLYQPTDFPLARWADVLLMYAEAVARKTNAVPTGEAMQGVTDVRARAGLPPFSGAAVASYNGFMDALLAERGHEMLFEGHRKVDLIRFNKYRHNFKVIKNIEPTHQYVPLPDYAVKEAESYGRVLTQTFERPGYDQDR
jgi:hypothetical protein